MEKHINIVKNNKIFSFFYLNNTMIKIFCLIQIIYPILNKCNKTTPILINNNTCSLEYCTQSDFDDKKCVVDNEIVQTQWLNNIIWIGDKDFRYINFATYSNGDMIVETTSNPGNSKRMFYAIKKNGRSFFKSKTKNMKTKYYSIKAKDQINNEGNIRYEAEIFIATVYEDDNNAKEYLVSVPKGDRYTELYDFDNDKIYQTTTQDFLQKPMNNSKGCVFSYKSITDNITYNIFGFISSNDKSVNIKQFKFTSVDIKNNNPIISTAPIQLSTGKITSCFMTTLNLTMCFFIYNNNLLTTTGFVTVLSNNILVLAIKDIDYISEDENSFFKCIHYQGEIGIFVYYYYDAIKTGLLTTIKTYYQHPKIIFLEYSNFKLNEYIGNIILDRREFNVNLFLNDIIKISNDKVCFISTSDNRDVLYVVLLTIFGTEKVIIKYYDIEIFNLYNYKIFMDLRAHPYNDFISFAFSFCQQEICTNNSDPHYTALMIFGYPNGTDSSLNVTHYLLINNNIKINNITINLTDNFVIENNIFGFVYSDIQVLNISECDNINIYSSTKSNKIINRSFLNKSKSLNLEFKNLNSKKCKIEYAYYATEPEYQDDLNYYSEKIGTDDKVSYESQRGYYKGRSIYYNIILDKDLETLCDKKSCELCLKDSLDYCITCENNYTIFKIDDEIQNKTCKEEDEESTIENTIIETVINTERINEIDVEKSYVLEKEKEIKKEEEEEEEEEIEKENFIKEDVEEKEEKWEKENKEKENENIKEEAKEEEEKNEEKGIIKEMEKEEEEVNKWKNEEKEEEKNEEKEEEKEEKKNEEAEEEKEEDKNEDKEEEKNGKNKEEKEEDKNEENDKELIKEEEKELEKEGDNRKEKEREKETEKIEEPNIQTCTYEKIINNKCTEGTITNEQIKECYNKFKEKYLTSDYDGENIIIQTKNALFELSTLEEQSDSTNPNISSVDLGECETILKKQYNLTEEDSLIILKTDLKSADLSSTYVQYEIYHPYTYDVINLDYCENIKIIINSPVNLSEETLSLYNSLLESGYNLFDVNDSFYNDICTLYTTENGTDVTLIDRQNELFSNNGNISMCQIGCDFELYNDTTKKSKCECEVQKNSTQTNVIQINFNGRLIYNSFLVVLKNSNFMILKCFKIAFDLNSIKNNIGRIIISIIFFLFLVLLFIYLVKDRKNLFIFISQILQYKLVIMKKRKNKKNKKRKRNKNIEKIKRKDNIKIIERNRKIICINKIGTLNNNPKKNIKNKNKDKNKDINKQNKIYKGKRTNPPKKIENTGFINSNFFMGSNSQIIISQNNNDLSGIKMNLNFKNKFKKEKVKGNKKNNINYKNNIKQRQILNNNLKYNNNFMKYNDEELNSLSYNQALKYDKRTYLEYYFSLLKKKNIILFWMIPSNDYNLTTLKTCLFLLNFSLYFTINGFFFTDSTMHNYFKNNGEFNFLYEISQVIYSTVISSAINILLKLLSLSERNLLKIKKENNKIESIRKAIPTRRYILLKFTIFYILSLILLSFFWYYISCFCGVYINTQIILIKDTFLTFGMSMIYPLGLNLVPGIFRILALRSEKKNKEFLYHISGLISLI